MKQQVINITSTSFMMPIPKLGCPGSRQPILFFKDDRSSQRRREWLAWLAYDKCWTGPAAVNLNLMRPTPAAAPSGSAKQAAAR